MFTPIQIVLLIFVFWVLDTLANNVQLVVKFGGQQVFRALLVGIIMGDIPTALLIGGTMQLMAMGLAGYGGASIPNYNMAVVIGSAYAIASGLKGDEALTFALTIGVPTATLGLQLDVLSKTINSFWYHKAQKDVEMQKYKKMYRDIFVGEYIFGKRVICDVLPIALFVLFGQPIVEWVLNNMPAWLNSGLKVVAGTLPALGMAMLMIYMPVKENLHWLILGFALYVYFSQPIISISIIGGVIAVLTYKKLSDQRKLIACKTNSVANVDEGGIGDE